MDSKIISHCSHKKIKDYCKLCGVYLHQNKAIKTQRFSTVSHISLLNYLNSMRTKTAQTCQIEEDLSYEMIYFLESLCQKFEFTNQTLALGIYIHYYLLTHHKQTTPQSQNLSSMRLRISSCLIVAAKAIELDKNVPYLNRFQRYAQKSKSKQDYKNEQRYIFQTMNFNLQYSTFMTFLNFYLTAGVVFESDSLNELTIIQLEDDIIASAKDILKKGVFVKYNPQNLAISIIQQSRKKFNLVIWPNQLIQVSGIKSDQSQITEDNILRPIKTQRELNCPNSTETKQINIINKKKQIFKTLNIKQNSFNQVTNLLYLNHKKSNSILKGSKSFSLTNINHFVSLIGKKR